MFALVLGCAPPRAGYAVDAWSGRLAILESKCQVQWGQCGESC